jgi:hypothetical protein
MTRTSMIALSFAGLVATTLPGCGDQTSSDAGSQVSAPQPDSKPVPAASKPSEESSANRSENSQRNGFLSNKDIFEAYPGDEVTFEEADGEQAMRWTTAMNGKHRACIKDLKTAPVSGATRMRFQVRTDIPGDLWVQVKESDGEAFYQIIKATKEWKDVSLTLADMKLNEDEVENRKLDVDRISQVIVIDLVGLGRASGKRSVWFANWGFTDDDGKIGDQSSVIETPKTTSARALTIPVITAAALLAKVDSVLPSEEEERWLRIPWRTNLMQARVDSQQQAKPMLIWIMDGNVLGCT